MNRRRRRSIGLMFQDFALFPHLNVLDNVAFGLRKSARAAREAQALDYLGRVGMADHARKYPHELSGGEQQRVALARALVPHPRVMLMDEPFSGLDNRLRDDVRDTALAVLKDEGAGVLLVTHDPEEALRMADRIALMRAGRIVQIGAPYHIYNNPVGPHRRRILQRSQRDPQRSALAAGGYAVRPVPDAGAGGRGRCGDHRPAATSQDRDRRGRSAETQHKDRNRGDGHGLQGTVHGAGQSDRGRDGP